MKKRLLAFLLFITLCAGLFPSSAFAASSTDNVSFYNAITNELLYKLNGENSIYATVDFVPEKTGKADIMVAGYTDENYMLFFDILDTIDVTEGSRVQHTTKSFSPKTSDFAKLFVWDHASTPSPLLETPGYISNVAHDQKKFETKFTGDFLYRVGNDANTPVSLGTLFNAKKGAKINNPGVYVTIDNIVEGTTATGTFTPNTSDWTKGTIKFSGTGVVKVTIQDYDYCAPTVLYLEVVNGKNITTAQSSLDGKDVVVLNDLEIQSNGTVHYNNCTVYGNGFTFSV